MKLTENEKYYARKLFKLEVYSKNGQAFENFFVRIMQFYNKSFLPVKPQGQFGDRKNDGFIKQEGKYYQIYAPEILSNNESKTIDKLVADFKGLYSYWNSQVTPIKEFFYVLNDKYQGGFPTLHPELEKIEKTHSGVKCFPFFNSNLEDIFLDLDKDQIMDLIGPILMPEEIESFDSSVLAEVIRFILDIDMPYESENIPVKPDFEQKLTFNNLSVQVANILKFSSYQEGSLKEYFRFNSNFAKEDLRNKLSQLYQLANQSFPTSDDRSDLIFFDILKKICPSNKLVNQNAAFVLMAYYFGYCDIFEEPS